MQSKPDMPAQAAAAASPSAGTDEIVQLEFDWQQKRVDARLDRGSARENLLKVSCDLGPVPFTAEGAQRRMNIFAILEATRTGLQFHTSVSKNQRINLIAETRLVAPVTTSILISGIVTLLANARPYIELIDLLQQPTDSFHARH